MQSQASWITINKHNLQEYVILHKKAKNKNYAYRSVSHEGLQVAHLGRVCNIVFQLHMLCVDHLTSSGEHHLHSARERE